MEEEIQEVIHQNGKLQHLVMAYSSKEALVALYARVPTIQKFTLAEKLGCALTEMKLIEVNLFGKTAVDGVYAIGDCAHPMRSLATAVYTGNIAGAMLNRELIEERF